MKGSDKFVAYIFKVCKEKLTSVDKTLTVNGNTGVEGSDVILGMVTLIFDGSVDLLTVAFMGPSLLWLSAFLAV